MLSTAPSFAPSFQIIVIPPAEDLQPDYLVFEADDPREPELHSRPDCASLDDALARLPTGESAPVFDRTAVATVVMPRRSESEIRDDSEIVEVVKLRRTSAQPEEPKTRSLSWASRAFRSIKNIGRRPYAQEVFAASQATFTAIPPPITPPLARRRSATLSELFRTPPPEVPSTSSTLSTLQFLAGQSQSDDDGDDDEDQDERRRDLPPRASSPSPSTRTFSSSIRRRFSVLNFRKAREAPRPFSPPALSRDSTVPSTTSSSLPQTPTDETYFPSPPIPKDTDDDPDRTIGEMRLDSLHFDSLSFDVDNF